MLCDTFCSQTIIYLERILFCWMKNFNTMYTPFTWQQQNFKYIWGQGYSQCHYHLYISNNYYNYSRHLYKVWLCRPEPQLQLTGAAINFIVIIQKVIFWEIFLNLFCQFQGCLEALLVQIFWTVKHKWFINYIFPKYHQDINFYKTIKILSSTTSE